MTKKILSFGIFIAIMLLLVPQNIFAETAETSESDFIWDGNTIKKYIGYSQVVVIPGKFTKIDDNAFSGCSSLTNITIPNSVNYIGKAAFSGCSSLDSIIVEGKTLSEAAYFLKFTDYPKTAIISVLPGISKIEIDSSTNILKSVDIVSDSTVAPNACIIAALYNPDTNQIESVNIVKKM